MPKLVDIEDMRKCFKCGSFDTYTDADGNEHWAYNYDDNKKWTGDYLCNKCRMATGEMKKYYKDRYDEIKYVRDCRNARINVGSEKCKGCIGAQICAHTLGVDILDIENDRRTQWDVENVYNLVRCPPHSWGGHPIYPRNTCNTFDIEIG
jgi:hypothetical protein